MSPYKVPFVDYRKQYLGLKVQLDEAITIAIDLLAAHARSDRIV